MRLINADDLEEVLREHGSYYRNENVFSAGVVEGFLMAIEDLKETPTIEEEPVRHGEWKCVKAPKGSDFVFYQCSICGEPRWSREKYCANCGTRMEGAEK